MSTSLRALRTSAGPSQLVLFLAAALGGCNTPSPIAPPTVFLDVPGGDVQLTNRAPSAPMQSAPLTEPPLNLDGISAPLQLPSAPGGPPRNGRYAGLGNVTQDYGGLCENPIKITEWFVSGSEVSFGAFRGTIQSDGSLAMEARSTYISGRFNGSHFQGRVWRGLGEGCQYAISVDPTA